MTFLDSLKKENAKMVTGNGEIGYSTTLSPILDYSLKIGNSRFLPTIDIKNNFDKAYAANEDRKSVV